MSDAGKNWFGPKRFGFGIGPRSWQGWLTIVVYIAVVVLASRWLASVSYPAARPIVIVIATIALVVVMVLKGSPRHRN